MFDGDGTGQIAEGDEAAREKAPKVLRSRRALEPPNRVQELYFLGSDGGPDSLAPDLQRLKAEERIA
jgi:hypothetical protein